MGHMVQVGRVMNGFARVLELGALSLSSIYYYYCHFGRFDEDDEVERSMVMVWTMM